MAEDKKSFILYADYTKVISKLPREVKGDLLQLIFDYVNDLNPIIENNLLLEIAFEPIKLQLKRDLKKWDIFKEKQSENGKLGGRPKKKENPNNPSLISESQKSLTVTVNATVNENDIYKGNFFYIGLELYKMPISHYIKVEHQKTLEIWQMQNKDISIEKIFESMDKECVGKHFTDNEHTLNSFKWTYKDLKKGLKQFQPEQNVKASSNYGRKQ